MGSVFVEKFVEKAKAKGVDVAEQAVYDLFLAMEEAAIAAAAESTDPTEKAICVVAGPLMTSMNDTIKKLVDFDKDGQLG